MCGFPDVKSKVSPLLTVSYALALKKPFADPMEQNQPVRYEPIRPCHGVVTLFGYGTTVRVQRGHLLIEDGICDDRRVARFPRVGHGLKRLIVIGSDGMISFAAIKWLAGQNASFVMLERDGSVLATTGPVCSSDARLRRAQALASRKHWYCTPARNSFDQGKAFGPRKCGAGEITKYFHRGRYRKTPKYAPVG